MKSPSVATLTIVMLLTTIAHAQPRDPQSVNYTGQRGLTLHVSKLGDDTDGKTWQTAFNTIQKALQAIPGADGGHTIIIRPDTYVEARYSGNCRSSVSRRLANFSRNEYGVNT